jgi:hypothetical protein
MRLGAGDLGGEKHALNMRLSAATLMSKSMRSSCILRLRAGDLGGESMRLLSRLSAGDPGGEHNKHALDMRLSAGDLGGESMRSSSDLVLATLEAKTQTEENTEERSATLFGRIRVLVFENDALDEPPRLDARYPRILRLTNSEEAQDAETRPAAVCAISGGVSAAQANCSSFSR